jgi:hypothetical protein
MNSVENTEDDFIREVAEEEGLSFEEVKESVENFKSLLRAEKPFKSKKNKVKQKTKRKMIKNSRKINR